MAESSPLKMTLKDYRKLQERQKRELQPLPWVLGLWTESARINQWIGRHGILERRWLVYTWKPSETALKIFFDSLGRDILPRLVPLLKATIEEGWMVLSKSQYNQMVTLKRLLDSLDKISWPLLGKQKTRGIFSLRTVENLFFVLESLPDHPQNLIKNAALVGQIKEEWNGMGKSAAGALKQLFDRQGSPSLYLILEGLNLLWYRRMILFHDLFEIPSLPLVSPVEFEAPAEVQSKLDTYLIKLDKNLLGILQERADLQLISRYLPQGSGKATTMDQLQAFLSSLHGEKAGKFSLTTPVIPLLQEFLKAYLEAFGLMLSGKVPLNAKSPPEDVFDEVFFAPEVKILLELYDRMEEIFYFSPQLNYQRWMKISHQEEKGNEGELKVIAALTELAERIVASGKKMSITWKTETLGQWRDRIITGKGVYHGKPLENMVEDLCRTAFLLGTWCESPQLGKVKDQQDKIEKEFRRFWGEFERIAPPDRVKEVIKKWNLGTS